jgi:hypothetical protein
MTPDGLRTALFAAVLCIITFWVPLAVALDKLLGN